MPLILTLADLSFCCAVTVAHPTDSSMRNCFVISISQNRSLIAIPYFVEATLVPGATRAKSKEVIRLLVPLAT